MGPSRIDFVVGLVKAYCTRVGGGPFPTELNDDMGERLRKRGDEFGSVTGPPAPHGLARPPGAPLRGPRERPRRPRADEARRADRPRLDSKSASRYKTPSGTTEDFPIDDVEHAVPVYETDARAGTEDLARARSVAALPADCARSTSQRIERDTGCPVVLVSVGSRRDETIVLEDPFAR